MTEGEPIHFECQVEPKIDPNLKIQWFHNGKLLAAGHRFKTNYDFGFVSMDIMYAYAEDSGDYECRATNSLGTDSTRAKVSCKSKHFAFTLLYEIYYSFKFVVLPSILLNNQVPKGMKKSDTLMQMEATIKKYTSEIFLTEEDIYDIEKKQPPRFVTQILSQTELVEMQSTKFECQLAPVGDPNMKVEWFFNGKPLLHSM
jgi:titin